MAITDRGFCRLNICYYAKCKFTALAECYGGVVCDEAGENTLYLFAMVSHSIFVATPSIFSTLYLLFANLI